MSTVLVVDDAKFMRMRLTKLLADHGYTVLEAQDGIEAFSLYQSHRPDIVFMDWTMPGQDGLETLKEIIRFDAKARVVMLTALSQQACVAEAIASGAKSFLVKPIDGDRVLKTISQILR